MALWDRLKNGIIGGAVGFAARDALEPIFEPVKQEGWKSNRNRILPAMLAAELRAEDGPDPGQLADDAARGGFSDGRYAAMVEVATRARADSGVRRVALSGGVWQNVVLLERALTGLERAGFEVILHRRVPANDGGLALGQAVIAALSSRG